MLSFDIKQVNTNISVQLQHVIDSKTKPVGSLGLLEELALQIGNIQQSLSPSLINPHVVVFAGDHGIAKTGLVNPYPQEVTYQMVLNFLAEGAAINVFARQHQIHMKVVDAGVNHNFGGVKGLIDSKIGYGTANYLEQPAMTGYECERSFIKGAEIVYQIYKEGCNIIGFGEMGIGNTSSAALLMSGICNLPIATCVGRGTGANDEQLNQKIATLEKVQVFHSGSTGSSPEALLATYGGFEIAQMCGGMLKAASLGMTVMIDGFISSAAALIASKLNPYVLDYLIFTHVSEESGHAEMLNHLGAKPVLNLGMRLGEGSGCAVAYPIIKSACLFLNEMASFEDAGVSKNESR